MKQTIVRALLAALLSLALFVPAASAVRTVTYTATNASSVRYSTCWTFTLTNNIYEDSAPNYIYIRWRYGNYTSRVSMYSYNLGNATYRYCGRQGDRVSWARAYSVPVPPSHSFVYVAGPRSRLG